MNKRIPKKGFNRNAKIKRLEVINIKNIIYFIKKGRLDATQPITIKSLFLCGALSKVKYGVKVLGKGAEELSTLGYPIHLEITDASQTVINAVKNAGGSVTSVYI